jgi:hypothetical protein
MRLWAFGNVDEIEALKASIFNTSQRPSTETNEDVGAKNLIPNEIPWHWATPSSEAALLYGVGMSSVSPYDVHPRKLQQYVKAAFTYQPYAPSNS